jgi:hypothetical protein
MMSPEQEAEYRKTLQTVSTNDIAKIVTVHLGDADELRIAGRVLLERLAQPVFTTDKPTAQGWYWYRETPTGNPHPVIVFGPGGQQWYVWPIDNMELTAVTRHLDHCSGEFAGPIFPPEPWDIEGYVAELQRPLPTN